MGQAVCLADSNAMIRGEQEKMEELVTEMAKVRPPLRLAARSLARSLARPPASRPAQLSLTKLLCSSRFSPQAAALAKHGMTERLSKVPKSLGEQVEKSKAMASRAPRRQSTRNLRGSAAPSRRGSTEAASPQHTGGGDI